MSARLDTGIVVNLNMYKAAVLISPEDIRIEDRTEPHIEDGEALIKVKYAGICGTDISLFRGQYKVPLPIVLGHEFSGEVVGLGEEVEKSLLGKRVVGEINNTCIATKCESLCPFCEIGLSNHCSKRTVIGIISHDGAFSQLIKVPARNLHILPSEISLEEGVFVEPLAAALQTFELTPLNRGDTVAVLGAGRLGVLVCAVASAQGAEVIALSRSKWKLDRAKIFGASGIINSSLDDPVKRIRHITGGLGADIVVECTGTPDGLSLSLELVRTRGTVALKTTCGRDSSGINLTKAVVDEICIQGSRCGPFKKAIEMLNSRTVSVLPLISDFYPIGRVKEAITTADKASKVIIDLEYDG